MDVEAFRKRLKPRKDGLLEFRGSASEIDRIRAYVTLTQWVDAQRIAATLEDKPLVVLRGIAIMEQVPGEYTKFERERGITWIAEMLE